MKVALPERLQAATLDELVSRLRLVGNDETVEVDGSRVERVDTAGLQLLVLLHRAPRVTLTCSSAIAAAARVLGIDFLQT